MDSLLSRMSPLMRRLSTRSLRRLTERSRVDLPHPDGPIIAVIFPREIGKVTSNSACLAPYHRQNWSMARTGSSRAKAGWISVWIFSPRPIASRRPLIIDGADGTLGGSDREGERSRAGGETFAGDVGMMVIAAPVQNWLTMKRLRSRPRSHMAARFNNAIRSIRTKV